MTLPLTISKRILLYRLWMLRPFLLRAQTFLQPSCSSLKLRCHWLLTVSCKNHSIMFSIIPSLLIDGTNRSCNTSYGFEGEDELPHPFHNEPSLSNCLHISSSLLTFCPSSSLLLILLSLHVPHSSLSVLTQC